MRAVEKDKSFTYPMYQDAIKHLRKSDNNIENDDDTGQNGGADTSLPATDGNTLALQHIVAKKAEKISGFEQSIFEQSFSSQINSEAKRVKLDPEQIKGLYISLLQTMLSTVQNMGVEK